MKPGSSPTHADWQKRYQALPTEKRAEFDRAIAGQLPEHWENTIQAMKQAYVDKAEPKPGIFACGEVFSALADTIPEMISGAPDLEATTQHKRQFTAFSRNNLGGRYIHYGVREHAMGTIVNGMAVHKGVIPVGVTYVVFSDYMRHTLRMAALMEIPSIFVLSHDSIGIGKNGPTHQPVESLASFRAYPNLWTLRPADVVEMAECWQLALQRRHGLTIIICSRQPLPPVRTTHHKENLSARGGGIDAELGAFRTAG